MRWILALLLVCGPLASAQEPAWKIGQVVMAPRDLGEVPSNREGWRVERGEVYRFEGFTEGGLAARRGSGAVFVGSPPRRFDALAMLR